jgi:hypothetical protein
MKSSEPEDRSDAVVMRVCECNVCGEALAAANDDELLRRMRVHDEVEHPEIEWNESRAAETVAREAYDAGDS